MEKVFKKNLVLILFVISGLLSIVLISAELPSPQEVLFDPIKDLFTNWEAGNLNINIAKYLFFVLITIFIWSVLDLSGVMPNAANWIVSLVVGFLSIAYITPNQIWVILTSYDALGLTLIFLVPLIILGLFTLRIAVVGGARGVLAQRLIWGIYFVFLIFSFIIGIIDSKIKVSDPFGWSYLGIVIITAIIFFFNNQIIKKIGETGLEAESEAARGVMRRAVALRRMEAAALREQSGDRRRGP